MFDKEIYWNWNVTYNNPQSQKIQLDGAYTYTHPQLWFPTRKQGVKERSDSRIVFKAWSGRLYSRRGGRVWRTILIGIETTVMESCIGGERLGSTSKNIHAQVRIYSQGEVWSLLDVKLLEGNMGVRERFWLKGLNRILADSSEGHQRMAEDEKPDCISRGITC